MFGVLRVAHALRTECERGSRAVQLCVAIDHIAQREGPEVHRAGLMDRLTDTSFV